MFYAVADVGPVPPHAVETRFTNRRGLDLETVSVRGHANLNKGPLGDVHMLEGLENAVFVLCSDGREEPSGTPVKCNPVGAPRLVVAPKMTSLGFSSTLAVLRSAVATNLRHSRLFCQDVLPEVGLQFLSILENGVTASLLGRFYTLSGFSAFTTAASASSHHSREASR